jgi:hypothetical protein
MCFLSLFFSLLFLSSKYFSQFFVPKQGSCLPAEQIKYGNMQHSVVRKKLQVKKNEFNAKYV